MFAVKCEAAFLWHPAVHHSLLLLRALRQRHTLLLEPVCTTTTAIRPEDFWCLSRFRSFVAIDATGTSSAASFNDAEVGRKESPLLQFSEGGLRRVHDPQHIFYFFPAASSGLEHQRQLQAYLDAALVADHVLHAVDDVLQARNTAEMEVTRQTHSRLMDLLTRLETSLEGDDDELPRETENWSTWPLFTILKFLVEEAGLLLGPFPRVAKAYRQLQDSKAVVAHTRLVNRTLQLTRNDEGFFVPPSPWAYRGFLRDVQRQLADYTADPAERMVDGVSGEKGPLKARVSGARFGMQLVSARMPWTMQREWMRRP
ncbi:hypothetical protein TraAM80_01330 [Trypanosoma rangeli]|uniref:Uncharacterized protein n=1 Tax=Trypanosoma rangeli TaxID=5698 RepID=A0A3R7KN88_TRYRA|nr:uncharacterized protein TraAM80_01330 [Trypanosoma rangeli]RNF10769.1 hypothetical protein TraAM80_01330 [Trypanosoma rangeli]|eukprot:RNF10769.1 hypothetical protein TraAM80_01330 [Trypanosoma rangeli]